MKLVEIKEVCKSFIRGSNIAIKKKSIRMKKYGRSTRFIPRTVNYPEIVLKFHSLTDDGYLLTEDGGCYYYTKVESLKAITFK